MFSVQHAPKLNRRGTSAPKFLGPSNLSQYDKTYRATKFRKITTTGEG